MALFYESILRSNYDYVLCSHWLVVINQVCNMSITTRVFLECAVQTRLGIAQLIPGHNWYELYTVYSTVQYSTRNVITVPIRLIAFVYHIRRVMFPLWNLSGVMNWLDLFNSQRDSNLILFSISLSFTPSMYCRCRLCNCSLQLSDCIEWFHCFVTFFFSLILLVFSYLSTVISFYSTWIRINDNILIWITIARYFICVISHKDLYFSCNYVSWGLLRFLISYSTSVNMYSIMYTYIVYVLSYMYVVRVCF